MKKILIIAIVLLISASFLLTAEDKEIKDAPLLRFTDPTMLAMGNVQGPTAAGYTALFTNPAGIARKNTLNLLSLNLGPYVHPSQELLEAAMEVVNGNQGFEYLLGPNKISFNAGDPGFNHLIGSNISIGSGLSLAGFGVGVRVDIDVPLEQPGETLATLETKPNALVSGAAGYSLGLPMGPENTLYVGADARAIAQVAPKKTLDLSSVQELMEEDNENAMDDLPVILGLGIGYDAGVIYEAGPLTLSAAAKNLFGTKINQFENTAGELIAAAENDQSLQEKFDAVQNEDTRMETDYDLVIPMSLLVGIGYEVNIGAPVGLKLAADYEKVLYADEATAEKETFWKGLHAGAEVSLLNMIKVRGGINQGYLTGGVGLDLFVAEINASYYSRELGLYAGHKQNEALALEVALRL